MRARCGALLRVAGAGTLVALLAAGCATPAPPRDPRVRPVENLAERLVFQGFSVLPPQGQGWLIVFGTPCIGCSYVAAANIIISKGEIFKLVATC